MRTLCLSICLALGLCQGCGGEPPAGETIVVGAANDKADQLPSEGFGYVVVNNRSSEAVELLIQKLDLFGQLSWEPVTDILPESSVTLENVRQGATLGARALDDPSLSWPPRTVIYPAVPIFSYNLEGAKPEASAQETP